MYLRKILRISIKTEMKNKETSKVFEIFTNINISSSKLKINQKQDMPSQSKSDKLIHLRELNFDVKAKKLFESEKFIIGNQFDQKGCEKFLSAKDECLKCICLDETILNKKRVHKKNTNKHENKSKNKVRIENHDVKDNSRITIINKNDESFISTESIEEIFNDLCQNLK